MIWIAPPRNTWRATTVADSFRTPAGAPRDIAAPPQEAEHIQAP